MPELRLENSLVDDRYEVRERLGLGSYAEIFVARDHATDGREVVIKALNPSLQGTPDADLERTLIENFQNEALALDAVRHPQVILRLGHGTAADLRGVPFHYLVLEYMPGSDLLRLCRSRPGNALGLNEALCYFKQVCEALAYAHSQGIIHRDLKPNNFLLSADHQTVKIADFGVAKMTTQENTEITRVGAGIYAPPEHHPDDTTGRVGRLTAAADIYSLAKSFYTVICGRAPSEFVRRPITSLPPAIRTHAWAEALLAVLGRATADEVEERYATVVEFWSDLANVATLAEPAVVDEMTTRVKPRLKIDPGSLPHTPVRPDFEPLLASSETAAPAPPPSPIASAGAARPYVDYARPPKIVVDLKPPAPPAVPQPARKDAPPATKPPAAPPALEPSVAEIFTAQERRRIFIGLLILAFIGALISVYHYTRSAQDVRSTQAKPDQIEVVKQNLNVRSGPGIEYEALGTVANGTHHRVLGKAENGWLRIEVSQWNEDLFHAKDGWVNGGPDFVKPVE